MNDDWAQAAEIERAAYERLHELFDEAVQVCAIGNLWTHGDGQGGVVLGMLRQKAAAAGLEPRWMSQPPASTKRAIPQGLRMQVFERDGFTCRHCGAQKNLQADHIYPESLGGAATLENLQTLCKRCNVKKGAQV